MRRLALLFAAGLSFSLAASGSAPPELFQKAKTQFRLRSYPDALATLDLLERESRKPENESYRTALGPGLAFYRGACLAALGRDSEARSQFEIYLAHQPSAALDPSIYPRPVVRVLEETRLALAGARTVPAESGSITAAYKAFSRPQGGREERLGEDWADGPVRFLLSPDDRRDSLRLSDPVSRSEFVVNFWRSHDPRPETADNELREEFDKRVAFADSLFTQEEVRGALTDRGMVFILLGPPTWVGRKPITTGEDTSDPAGMSRWSRNDVVAAQSGKDPRASGVIVDNMTGPTSKLPSAGVNWREIWHFRREILPRGVPYQQVDLEFITRRGYGENVLQRDDRSLAAMDAARRSLLDHAAWIQATR